MARIIEFEGRRVQVPDDATDDEVQSILGEVPQGDNPIGQAIENVIPAARDFTAHTEDPGMRTPMTNDTSIASYLGGLTDQVGRGLAEGVIDVAGLPNTLSKLSGNVTDWGLQKFGVDPDTAAVLGKIASPAQFITPDPSVAKGGLDALNNSTADLFGVERPRAEPDNTGELYAHRIAEMLGGAGVPVGGALATAERVGLEGARKLPGLARWFVEPAAVAPGKFVAREASLAAGAGTGAATANTMVDPNTTAGKFADVLGSLVGGGAVGLSRILGSFGKTAVNALRQNPNYLDDVVKEAVVDRIGKAAGLDNADQAGGVMDTSPLVDAIENPTAARPSSVIPGYQETLADQTKNPGLAALEYGRQQGPNAGQFIVRRSENNDVVDAAMRGVEPQAQPAYLRDALSSERDRRLNEAASGRVASEDEVARALGLVTPTSTGAQRGNVVRTALEDAQDTARTATEDAYARVATNGRMVDPAPLTASLDEAVGGLTEAERNLVPAGLIDRVRRLGQPLEDGPQPTGILDANGNPIMRDPAGPENIDLREATTLRSELQRMRAAALADPRAERGGRNAARVLDQMRRTVDDYIGANLSPEENTALDAAKATKFSEAENFTRQGDPVAEVLQRYEGGQPKVRDDRVAGKFVNAQAMDRLFAQADTPDVRNAIREEVLSKADLTSPERIQQFATKYGEQLNRFPGLGDQIEQAATARANEAAARSSETTLQRELGTDERPGRSTVGKYLQFSNANSERAISEVLAAKDPGKAADELMTFVGDDAKAAESARAAFWEKLKSKSQSVDNTQRSMSGTKAWRGDWMKRWLDEPSTMAVAERLYQDKPEDLAAIRLYADVLDNADLRVRGKATATSGTSQGTSNILTPETLQSRMYAYMRGQISGTYLGTSIASVAIRRAVTGARSNAIERLTDKVLLNPDLAKELLKENNPANRAALARKAKGWLGSEAGTILELINEDDSEDGQVKRAINGP